MELKENFNRAIGESVEEIFSTIFSSKISEIPYKKADDVANGLVCSVGIAGHVEGSVSLWLSKDSACRAVSKMLGMELNELNSDVADGCGEIANLIAGGVKARVGNAETHPEISTPTVIEGQGLKMFSSSENVEIHRHFMSDDQISLFITLVYHVPNKNVADQKIKNLKSKIDATAKLNELLNKKID